MTDEGAAETAITDVTVQLVPTSEYEVAAVATAVVHGPAGAVRIRRRYEALPRHNDVVDSGRVDSNDQLVGRSDAVHVHTRLYDVEEGAYLRDAHDTWTPDRLSILEDPETFLAACRDHHVSDGRRAYHRAAAER